MKEKPVEALQEDQPTNPLLVCLLPGPEGTSQRVQLGPNVIQAPCPVLQTDREICKTQTPGLSQGLLRAPLDFPPMLLEGGVNQDGAGTPQFYIALLKKDLDRAGVERSSLESEIF